MTKYIVEDDIDFYGELNKDVGRSVNITSSSNIKECLISNQPLNEKSITLKCGHSFNYEPLFNDIMNHKKKFNAMERNILREREIRCPYCRNIQTGLLPYYEELGLKKIHGVNFFDESLVAISAVKKETIKNSSYFGQCSYVHENVEICNNKFVSLVETLGKSYCTYHKYKAIQEHVKKEKMVAKAAQKAAEKAAKAAQKAAEKVAKATAKEAAKAAKKVEKITIKEKEIGLCKELIKTGKNAGKECSCNVFENGKCKRHTKKE
jgi:histone H3/H4